MASVHVPLDRRNELEHQEIHVSRLSRLPVYNILMPYVLWRIYFGLRGFIRNIPASFCEFYIIAKILLVLFCNPKKVVELRKRELKTMKCAKF